MTTEILKSLRQLHPDGTVFSVFVKEQTANRGGYFNNRTKASEEIARYNGRAQAVYVSLNPCEPSMLAKANNSFKPGEGKPSDKNIICYRHFYIDVDPVRPSGTCSTDQRHSEALEATERIKTYLICKGWPEPSIQGDTGNGGNLIYRVSLPANEDTKKVFQNCLKALNERFATKTLKIDSSVCDPSRITRVLGTMNRKGDEVPEQRIRHRQSKILKSTDNPVPLSIELLQTLSAEVHDEEEPAKATERNYNARLDVRRYLDHYGIEIVREKRHGNSTLYCLRHCIFDPSHSPNESAIVQSDNGALAYQCFHDSCKEKTWTEAKEIISGGDSLKEFSPTKDRTTEPTEIKDIFHSLPTLSDIASLDLKIEYLLDGILPENGITILYGKGGRGKSTLMMQIGYCISEGLPFEGLTTKKTTVVYIDYDNPLNVISEKARRFGDTKNFRYWHITHSDKPSRIDSTGWDVFKSLPKQSLLIFDTLKSCQGMDMDRDHTMALIMGRFRELRDEGFTIVILHHSNRRDLIKNNTTITDNADHVLALKPLKVSNHNSDKEDDEPEQVSDLIFGCGQDDKSRYAKHDICLSFDGQIFERIQNPENENYENIKKLIIEEIEHDGTLPNQSKIVAEATSRYGFTRPKTLEILNRGEGRYWKATRVKEQNKKVYEPVVKLLDSIYGATTKQLPLKESNHLSEASENKSSQSLDSVKLSSCQECIKTTGTTEVIELSEVFE
jgi:archaellum biogenesis ATPase FlaH